MERPPSPRERASACLWGLAIGDALGMPTQRMSAAEVAGRFGVVDRFLAADADHPLAAGLAAGSVTDDTEQAVLLGRHLVAHGGHVDPDRFAAELVDWEDEMRARGSLDLLGPSTRRAVAAIRAGVAPAEAGRTGTTNGAAMRVAPVGIAVAPDALVDRVLEASALTHGTAVALSAATAVAAVVSAAVTGWPAPDAVALALDLAARAAAGAPVPDGSDVAVRIARALELADPDDPAGSVEAAAAELGTSLAAEESVPMAFAVLAAHPDDPWAACCAAASLGGDSDTIAAMAGAMSAALAPTALPPAAVATVAAVNHLDLDRLAADLLALRPVPR